VPLEVPSADRVTLSRYLLGQLSAAEEDAVEDRFAADDTYFALYEEIERSLIHDYATGALEPVDVALFERNYLVTAERRQRVIIVRALLAVESEGREARRLWSAPLPRLASALVFAALIVAVAALWSYWRRSEPQQSATLRQVPGAAPTARKETHTATAPAEGPPTRNEPPLPALPDPTEASKAQKTYQLLTRTTKASGAAPTEEQVSAAAEPPARAKANATPAPAEASPVHIDPPPGYLSK